MEKAVIGRAQWKIGVRSPSVNVLILLVNEL